MPKNSEIASKLNGKVPPEVLSVILGLNEEVRALNSMILKLASAVAQTTDAIMADRNLMQRITQEQVHIRNMRNMGIEVGSEAASMDDGSSRE